MSGKTAYLLAGEKAGPEKLKKAESLGVTVIGEAEFRALIGGEIPDQAGNDERKDRNDGMMEIKPPKRRTTRLADAPARDICGYSA